MSERNDQDPAAQVAAEVRARLRAMGGDELVELCAQLLTTYVIEGVVPLARAGESRELAADAAGEESFAQMLKRLKAAKADPVLERFIIDGENISVRIDGQGVLPITEYRRPVGPPAGPGVSVQVVQRREGAPGAAGSIYNRALYQPEAAAPPLQQRPAAAVPDSPRRAGSEPAPPAPQAPQKPQVKEEPRNDRFSLIELE
jgi:hypothetical protein